MKNIILFDDQNVWSDLLPISFTRPISEIRIGIRTIYQKWQATYPTSTISYLTTDYLQEKFKLITETENLFIRSNVTPTPALVATLAELEPQQAILFEDKLIAYNGTLEEFQTGKFDNSITLSENPEAITMLYDIFLKNEQHLMTDFKEITAGRTSEPISPTNTIIGDTHFPDGTPKIFIEPGAYVEGVYLNNTNGAIYIGKDSTIMEGTAIRAPFAACEHVTVNMCAKIYGATTFGPYCKVGGEVANSVIIGYSNKGHDGYLGNAVIGEWCNIGAGSNASNLKNDYTEIKLWNYTHRRFLRTGLQFCGLIMGDHSKAGINTMFNTATVVGVGVNIHGTGYPRNFVASFTEGGPTGGYADAPLDKFYAIAQKVMARRNIQLTDTDKSIFESIYNIAEHLK